jgi:hypothetical protein
MALRLERVNGLGSGVGSVWSGYKLAVVVGGKARRGKQIAAVTWLVSSLAVGFFFSAG